MGEVITEEIDLRPMWRRWGGPPDLGGALARISQASRAGLRGASSRSLRPSPSRRTAIVCGAGGVLLAIALFSSGGSKTQPPPQHAKPSALAAAVPTPVQEDTPIIIDATPEAVQITPKHGASTRTGGGAVESERGTLKLTSDPDVVVFEGDVRLGKTPLVVKLPTGRHDLRLVNRAKHLEEKRRVDVHANQVQSRALSFGVGALRVHAPDGTKMFLNQRYLGRAPFKKIELAEGRHHLRLTHGSEVVSEWIEVPPSRSVDYRVNFPE